MTKLREWNPALKSIVEDTAFAACTLNFGPRVKTLVHTDLKNLPWGLCAVTALGNYNPDTGGHIILWDIKKVIRFPPGLTLFLLTVIACHTNVDVGSILPPGSTIFLPSAVARHSNVDIAENEERMSITQYSAGSLFRWVDYGFKSVANYLKQVGQDVIQKKTDERWKNGLSMFTLY
jgi:hypothetical protein